MERMTGIEPAYPAWEAGVLPLNYIRECSYYNTLFFFICQEKFKRGGIIPPLSVLRDPDPHLFNMYILNFVCIRQGSSICNFNGAV